MGGMKASLGQHQKNYTNLHVRGKLGYGEGPTPLEVTTAGENWGAPSALSPMRVVPASWTSKTRFLDIYKKILRNLLKVCNFLCEC